MSRNRKAPSKGHTGFPRVSGDEPKGWDLSLINPWFSPRERG